MHHLGKKKEWSTQVVKFPIGQYRQLLHWQEVSSMMWLWKWGYTWVCLLVSALLMRS